MNLVKENWTKEDIVEFNHYLKSIQRDDKKAFVKTVTNTKQEVLGIMVPEMKEIAKEIAKGNFLSYMDFNNNQYYETVFIQQLLLSNIKDISTFETYLKKYIPMVDSWATCDSIKIKLTKKNMEEWFKLGIKYSKHQKPFGRRIGLKILMHFQNDIEYTERILSILDSYYDEEEYYVNMMVAWFLCDMVIKQPEATIKLFNHHHFNHFVLHKAVSKCQDSFRITPEVKLELKKYLDK